MTCEGVGVAGFFLASKNFCGRGIRLQRLASRRRGAGSVMSCSLQMYTTTIYIRSIFDGVEAKARDDTASPLKACSWS